MGGWWADEPDDGSALLAALRDIERQYREACDRLREFRPEPWMERSDSEREREDRRRAVLVLQREMWRLEAAWHEARREPEGDA
jgi:hypothetical protein